MAIAVRTGEEIRQVQMVCLEELVPAYDLLRRVEELVNWHHVRASRRPTTWTSDAPGWTRSSS
ncbi:MAG TPA: hypothetical protein VHK00_03775 [Miltoncostaeaceae bacterium]|jgi:hypothetical protein|nr:hypothetical protein [Miltoncostaeaceae bacterium]